MQNENRSAKPRKLIWFASILAITLVLFVGFRPDRAIRVATGVVAAIESFTIPAFGALSDRVGRRPVYIFGAIFSALMLFPLFILLGTKNAQIGWIAIVLGLAVGHAAMYGPQASFLSELFGTKVRYSGVSLGYSLASIFAGALSPLIATGLMTPEDPS